MVRKQTEVSRLPYVSAIVQVFAVWPLGLVKTLSAQAEVMI
jgi:hypothetical protein